MKRGKVTQGDSLEASDKDSSVSGEGITVNTESGEAPGAWRWFCLSAQEKFPEGKWEGK